MYRWLLDAVHTEYEEVKLLKESGRGSVRLIRHRATGQRVILRRFRGDGTVYRRLLPYTCRNLPKILEAVEEDGEVLVLEEFIQGDTLDFLLKGGLFTPGETRKIVLQLCRALEVLHSMDAVHRDVKPENIILRGKDVVLIDFDTARLYKPEHGSDTQVLGTTGFAAPEQYGLSQSDIRADIYSLGVLINVMLTGRHPSVQLAGGHLGRVVERCTRVNPEKRYSSVLRLMEAI